MRHLKKLLLPAMTLLVVLAAALLPRWASQAEDARLLGRIHTEQMADSISFQSSDLPERLNMFAQWSAGAEVASLTQALADDEIMQPIQETPAPEPPVSGAPQYDSQAVTAYHMVLEERIHDELLRLFADNPLREALPYYSQSVGMEGLTGSRLLLWEPSGGLAASFLQVRWTNTWEGWDLALTLDEESQAILSLTLQSPLLPGCLGGWDAQDMEPVSLMAEQYFSYLGQAVEPLGIIPDAGTAWYLLPDTGTIYQVQVAGDMLIIRPDSSDGSTDSSTAAGAW